jgi:transcriptional regulator with XRE-family HTH domain
MEDEKLKYQIGRNIASYRKRAGLTQAGLAERLNYSDKAISKWERGESAPDVLTLVQLSEQFGITVNDLLVDPDALPEETGAVQQAMEQVVEKALKRKADKGTILSLSSILVWFVALFAYVMLSCFELTEAWSWIFFIYAIPANAIVLLSLRSAWHDFRWNQILISIIMWGSILSVYVSLLVFMNWNIWRMFLLGIPGQAAVLLWFRLFRKPKKEESHG